MIFPGPCAGACAVRWLRGVLRSVGTLGVAQPIFHQRAVDPVGVGPEVRECPLLFLERFHVDDYARGPAGSVTMITTPSAQSLTTSLTMEASSPLNVEGSQHIGTLGPGTHKGV